MNNGNRKVETSRSNSILTDILDWTTHTTFCCHSLRYAYVFLALQCMFRKYFGAKQNIWLLSWMNQHLCSLFVFIESLNFKRLTFNDAQYY